MVIGVHIHIQFWAYRGGVVGGGVREGHGDILELLELLEASP